MLFDGQKLAQAGAVEASTAATVVTAHASANTKGIYSQLIAATAHDSDWLLVQVGLGTSETNQADVHIDIAIGADGSEVVIISNLLISQVNGQVVQFLFPRHIPQGTRIAAAIAATTGGSTVRCQVVVIANGSAPNSLQRVTTYGAVTADSGGTSLDPGAVGSTKGAYVELTAACNEIKWLVVALGCQANTARADARFYLDIAIGAGGSEQVKVPNLLFYSDLTSDLLSPATYAFPCSIPAGSRIAARTQCTITDATDRLIDVVLYGVG